MPRTVKSTLDSIIKFLGHQKKTILLIVVVAAITLSLSIIIPLLLETTTQLNLPSIGTIHTIGVKAYYDPNLQNITTQIQWGTIYRGSTNNVTLYLKSISSTQTTLQIQTANWTFTNSSDVIVSGPDNTTPYLNLTWNYKNTVVNPNQIIPVTLTLSAAGSLDFIQFLINNNVTNFRFDITISATEQKE